MPWASLTGPCPRWPGNPRPLGSSPGNRQPALGPARAGHEHDRCDARLRKTHPRIDVGVPGRIGLEITCADIDNGGDASWADAQAADDNPERGKRIRATQGGRHRGMAGEHQPTYPHQEMTIAAE